MQVTGRVALTKRSPVIPFRQAAMTQSHTPNPHPTSSNAKRDRPKTTTFDRYEMSAILDLYGRKVAEGEWRDYAIDMGKDTATFSIFRRTSESPLLRIQKTPKLARKQGAYSIVAATGLILKRGHDLKNVLRVLDKSVRLVKA